MTSTISSDTTALGHHTSNCGKQPADTLLVTKTPGAASECGAGEEEKDATSDIKDEPGDFIETNCHWVECEREFPTQEDLVKVSTVDVFFFFLSYLSPYKYFFNYI